STLRRSSSKPRCDERTREAASEGVWRPPRGLPSGLIGAGLEGGTMVSSAGPKSPRRRRRARFGAPVALATLALVSLLLASCASSATATPTINLYLYPDNSGAAQDAVDNCNAQSNGQYHIVYQKLPKGADGQRQQMVRRLAAGDSSMDILGLDVTWAPEFAEA